jgi:AcrR family transcriptional regulator
MKEASCLEFAFEQSGRRTVRAKKDATSGAFDSERRAIIQATIQVLMKDGKSKLTTTRIDERAGVSVGTLYQYFPNKSYLLQALLKGDGSDARAPWRQWRKS